MVLVSIMNLNSIRQSYLNDYRDTDMITYAEFINLYRIYCINVQIGNVMAPADIGKFKFRIPLDHLFNFCKFYRNGIYNGRHELNFIRQLDFASVFRHEHSTTTDGKIRLDKIRWMMPRVTLNPELSLRVKTLEIPSPLILLLNV